MLTDDQEAAKAWLLPFLRGETQDQFAVLEGWAGCGKTWLVASLLEDLDVGPVAVAAPTHKAVQVLRGFLERFGVKVSRDEGMAFGRRRWAMATADRVDCKTLHSLLGLRLKERDDGTHETRPDGVATIRDYAVVVIDEASMVSADLARRVRAEVEGSDTRVLYVGDPAQLPPVNDGALSPVFGCGLKTRLRRIVRQAVGNPIIRASIVVRAAIADGRRVTMEHLVDALGDCRDEKTGDVRVSLQQGGQDAALASLLDALDWDKSLDARIVAYTNQRVLAYNRAAHEYLHGEDAPLYVPGERIVMQSQHDAAGGRRLMTSEEMAVVACDERVKGGREAWHIVAQTEDGENVDLWAPRDRDGLEREIGERFAEWRMAQAAGDKERAAKARDAGWAMRNGWADVRHVYAITAHKAQGSTFDVAVIDWCDMRRMRDANEFNRCLYVAMTRSRNFLVVVS